MSKYATNKPVMALRGWHAPSSMPARELSWWRIARSIRGPRQGTTSTFDLLKAEPAIGRAEAPRRAMLAYLNDGSSPKNAYPAYWGPFALIGEGAMR